MAKDDGKRKQNCHIFTHNVMEWVVHHWSGTLYLKSMYIHVYIYGSVSYSNEFSEWLLCEVQVQKKICTFLRYPYVFYVQCKKMYKASEYIYEFYMSRLFDVLNFLWKCIHQQIMSTYDIFYICCVF